MLINCDSMQLYDCKFLANTERVDFRNVELFRRTEKLFDTEDLTHQYKRSVWNQEL